MCLIWRNLSELTRSKGLLSEALLKTVNTTGPEGIRPHSEVTDGWLSH